VMALERKKSNVEALEPSTLDHVGKEGALTERDSCWVKRRARASAQWTLESGL